MEILPIKYSTIQNIINVGYIQFLSPLRPVRKTIFTTPQLMETSIKQKNLGLTRILLFYLI